MTEEELEAIEIIKSIININKENERTTAMLYVSDVDILLNLIEKLQKENEEYKLLNANIEKANRIIEGKEEYIPKDKIKELIKKDSEIDKVEFEDDEDLNYERKIIDVDYIEELLEE